MKKSIFLAILVLLVAAGCNLFKDDDGSASQNQKEQESQSNTPSIAVTEDVPVQSSDYVPGTHRFTSNSLGLTFTYLKSPFEGVEIIVTQRDNKISVHGVKEDFNMGQTIEVFENPNKLGIKEAIAERFLKDAPREKCFVETVTNGESKTNQVFAIINYPFQAESEFPLFTVPQECPVSYSKTNAVQYFMMDTTRTDRFFFVKIGQDSITSDGTPVMADGSGRNWSSSIEVIDVKK